MGKQQVFIAFECYDLPPECFQLSDLAISKVSVIESTNFGTKYYTGNFGHFSLWEFR